MFLSRNLRKCSERVGGQGLLAHAWAALDALVGARSTEQAAQRIWAHRADHPGSRLAWTADWALGRVALEHATDVSLALHWQHTHTLDAGGVLATGFAIVLADLAHRLGADRAGNCHVGMGVLDIDGRPLGVLVVLRLGGVLDTLGGTDDILARRGLVDHATLHVHEVGGFRGGCWTLTGDASAVGALHWTVHFVLFV